MPSAARRSPSSAGFSAAVLHTDAPPETLFKTSVWFLKNYHVQLPSRKRNEVLNIKSSLMNSYSHNSKPPLFIERSESIQLLTNMKQALSCI